MSEAGPRHIVVIGGGIAGLAAAHRLVELMPEIRVSLLESSARLGGVLSTVHEDGFEIEQSADNFITTTPWAIDLCRRLNLGDKIVETNSTCRRTFVVRNGRLHRLPDGFMMMASTQFWPLVTTPILSPLGKLRAAMEYFLPPQMEETDESMAHFVVRRLGKETYDRLVEPLVSAVYAADLNKLSVAATLSRFRDMERQHGSLIRAMRLQNKRNTNGSATESGARYSLFVTLAGGLSTLVDALAARLSQGSVHLRSPVSFIESIEGRWRVHYLDNQPPSLQTTLLPFIPYLDCDGVVLATPAHTSALMLQKVEAPIWRPSWRLLNTRARPSFPLGYNSRPTSARPA